MLWCLWFWWRTLRNGAQASACSFVSLPPHISGLLFRIYEPFPLFYSLCIHHLKKNSYYDFLLQSEEERIQQDSTTKVSLINPLSGYLQDSKDTSHEFLWRFFSFKLGWSSYLIVRYWLQLYVSPLLDDLFYLKVISTYTAGSD